MWQQSLTILISKSNTNNVFKTDVFPQWKNGESNISVICQETDVSVKTEQSKQPLRSVWVGGGGGGGYIWQRQFTQLIDRVTLLYWYTDSLTVSLGRCVERQAGPELGSLKCVF